MQAYTASRQECMTVAVDSEHKSVGANRMNEFCTFVHQTKTIRCWRLLELFLTTK